ncbi:hypothetical protein CASFOL_029786 [Castilleja foliolosa]|uniref:Phytocyanin domain-containing protein n=1 Tax=Castilleja foliolosa TaxID=1961234 RepID=A0ABD3CBZ8_9LAMI
MSGKGALDVAAAMVAIMLVLHFDMANSKNYMVGNKDGVTSAYGWTAKSPAATYYPSGIGLRTGDTLQFIYYKEVHNVVGVGPTGYKNCDGSNGRKYKSGNDIIALKQGWNYFICTTRTRKNGNMCHAYAMKIAVNAN